MLDLITSTAEIKAYLGLSGTSKDARIAMWNQNATNILASMLGLANFTVHTVTDEYIRITDPYHLVCNAFPVDTSSTITIKNSLKQAITGYAFEREPNQLRRLLLTTSEGQPKSLYYEYVYATYTAGYTVQGTLEVVDGSNSDLNGKTFITTQYGVSTTWTFTTGANPDNNEIEREDGNDTMAANIAEAIGGTSVGAVVTMPMGMTAELGTVDSSDITITNATIPSELKMLVAMIVGGALSESNDRMGGVVSYSIGEKSVTFASPSDKALFQSMVAKYMPSLNRLTSLEI